MGLAARHADERRASGQYLIRATLQTSAPNAQARGTIHRAPRNRRRIGTSWCVAPLPLFSTLVQPLLPPSIVIPRDARCAYVCGFACIVSYVAGLMCTACAAARLARPRGWQGRQSFARSGLGGRRCNSARASRSRAVSSTRAASPRKARGRGSVCREGDRLAARDPRASRGTCRATGGDASISPGLEVLLEPSDGTCADFDGFRKGARLYPGVDRGFLSAGEGFDLGKAMTGTHSGLRVGAAGLCKENNRQQLSLPPRT